MNDKLIYELINLYNAERYEFDQGMKTNYMNYHVKKSKEIGNMLSKILKTIYAGVIPENLSIEDIKLYLKSIKITKEQQKEITEIRSKALFKEIMGQKALEQKKELEKILNKKISLEGFVFFDEKGVYNAYKTENQLWEEFEVFSQELNKLLERHQITIEEYESYDKNLNYIYTYYTSCSKGEHIEYRKITNETFNDIEDGLIDENDFYTNRKWDYLAEKEHFEQMRKFSQEMYALQNPHEILKDKIEKKKNYINIFFQTFNNNYNYDLPEHITTKRDEYYHLQRYRITENLLDDIWAADKISEQKYEEILSHLQTLKNDSIMECLNFSKNQECDFFQGKTR